MEERRPKLVRVADGLVPPGPQTTGMERRQLVEHEDQWIGWVRTEPGVASGWHHHGDRDNYVLLISGSVTIEHGPGGREQLHPSPGDVVYLPPRTVHREVTPDSGPGEAFVVRIGSGPQSINVDGPDPELT